MPPPRPTRREFAAALAWFDGHMLVLHAPNKNTERARFFESEDTGETLKIIRPFPAS